MKFVIMFKALYLKCFWFENEKKIKDEFIINSPSAVVTISQTLCKISAKSLQNIFEEKTSFVTLSTLLLLWVQ